MNWEESKALTPLKGDFLREFFARRQDFFLTGGSALGIFYLQHRKSYDLDLFSLEDLDGHRLENEVRAIAARLRAECRGLAAAPDFRRYELRRGGEREILDFVRERMPQVDAEKARFGIIRVDTEREIAVNKICTLLNRGELKDLVDLYFLKERGFAVRDLLAAARLKEGGLDPAMISFLLAQLPVEALPDYLLRPLALEDLRAFRESLCRELADLSFPG